MSQIFPWGVYRSFSLITNGKWHMYVNGEFSQLLVCFAGFFFYYYLRKVETFLFYKSPFILVIWKKIIKSHHLICSQ